MLAGVDLLNEEAVADPHGAFRPLRAGDPVHWSARHRMWVLTRYADVVDAFRDRRLSADRIPPQPAYDLLRRWMVFRDPPDHDRLRRLTQHAFTPRAIDALRPRVEALVDELLDEVARRGHCDLITTFAFPLPAIVIAELLGVPAEDRERFKAWSQKIGAAVAAADIPGREQRTQEGVDEFTAYFSWLVERVKAGRAPAGSLLATLVAARDEGDRLSTDELVATCTLLLFAGHETTTFLIANAVVALLGNPQQLRLLRRDPSLGVAAVEEFLRFDGPLKATMRRVAESHERRGATLRAGDNVYLALLSANRDPERFADPDELNVARRPEAHVGFGTGIHHCLGAHLARLEGRVALLGLLHRFPGLTMAAGGVRWAPSLIARAPTALPVSV